MFIPHGLSLLWRNNTDVQIGFNHDRTHVVTGLYPKEVPLINQLSTPCTDADVTQWARSHGVDVSRARRIVFDLHNSPVLVDATTSGTMAGIEFHYAARTGTLAIEELSKHGVEIVGAGFIGAVLARILDAEGLGAIRVSDSTPVTPAQAELFGSTYVGQRLDTTINSRLRPRKNPPPTSILISVTTRVPPRDVARRARAADIPYLPVVIGETAITCGPLIVAGSPCIECQYRHETDRDPAYPFLVEQVSRLPALEPPTGSAYMAASWIAMIVLEYVRQDRNVLGQQVLNISGVSWPDIIDLHHHPECDCLPAGINDGDDC